MTHPALDPADPDESSPLFLPPSSSPPPRPSSPTTEDSSPNSPGQPSLTLGDLGDLGDASASPPPSTGSRRGAKLRELRKVMRGAVTTAGGVLHSLLTVRDSVDRAEGLWLPDEDDVENIAEPLASLASRRAPAAVDNPDTVDLVALVMALGAYVVKNLTLKQELYAEVVPEQVGETVDHAPEPATPEPSAPPFASARAHLGRRGGILDGSPDLLGYDLDGRGEE